MSTNNVLSCKVCMDANKPKSVYSSHRVKQNGVVVCPTLLSQECKYCHKKGHTVKFCSVLEKENERKKKQLADGSADNNKKSQRVEFKEPISTTNRFTVLGEQDELNETRCIIIAPGLNQTPRVKDAYPELSAKVNVIAPTLGGYATALKTRPTPLKTQTKTQQVQNKVQTETHKKLFATYDEPTRKISWADCESSDDEDEDEEEVKAEEGTCAW